VVHIHVLSPAPRFFLDAYVSLNPPSVKGKAANAKTHKTKIRVTVAVIVDWR